MINAPLTKSQVRALRALLKRHGKSPCGRKRRRGKGKRGNPTYTKRGKSYVRFTLKRASGKFRRGHVVKFPLPGKKTLASAAHRRAVKAKRRARGRWLKRTYGGFVWKNGKCYRKIPGNKTLKRVRR